MYHLVRHHKIHGFSHEALYKLSLMLLFWSIFDGIVGFVLPFLLKAQGISPTMLGLIYASSSLTGAVFDFISSKIFTKSTYRKFYLYMFILSLLYVSILFKANHISIFLVGMSLWGIYYDFHNLGNFDFVHRVSIKEDHSSYFAIIGIFRSLGYVIAPIIASILLVYKSNTYVLFLSLIPLFLSFFIFAVAFERDKNKEQRFKFRGNKVELPKRFFFGSWKFVIKALLPSLCLIMLISIVNAFIGTIGPLLTEELIKVNKLGFLFISLFIFPALFMGWFEGKITSRFGVKKVAYISFIIGCLILGALIYLENVYLIIFTVFISSCFTVLAMPAVSGFYEDYIDEYPDREHDVAGISDFFYNVGYIIGPLVAGLSADIFGLRQAFGILGILCAAFAYIIFLSEKENLA